MFIHSLTSGGEAAQYSRHLYLHRQLNTHTAVAPAAASHGWDGGLHIASNLTTAQLMIAVLRYVCQVAAAVR